MTEIPDPEPLAVLLPRIAGVYEGNARYHFAAAPEFSTKPSAEDSEVDRVAATRWSQHAMLAVSSFTIAASYWSMLDPFRAAADYWIASMLYRALQHDYWMPLALASGHRAGPWKVAHEGVEGTPAPTALAFAMIGDAVNRQTNARGRLHSVHRHYGNVRVGRLGLPLDLYARCADAMAHGDRRRFANDARLYLLRASEVLGSAAHDHFHWSRLHSSVLLAEPEAVAVGVAMSRVAHERYDISLRGMVEMEDAHASRIVDVAESVFDAAASAEQALRRELQAAAEMARERDLDREREINQRVERIANLVDEELPWRLVAELRNEYRDARGDQQRERIAAQLRALATVVADRLTSAHNELPEIFEIFALEARADPERIEWLAKRVLDDAEFAGRHAAWALRRAVHDSSGSERERIVGVIERLLREIALVGRFRVRAAILRDALHEH